MKCHDYQDQLYEYVEGTLSAGERAAAEQHFATCDGCRRALDNELKLMQGLSKKLQQTSETLTLRTDIRGNVLAASRDKSAPPTAAESIAGLWRWLKLAMIPTSLLAIAALLTIHFYDTRGNRPISVPVTPFANSNPATAVSVQMSYHLPARQFHQEGNLVVDTLVDETVVASGTFQPGGKGSISPELEIKTPL